MEIYMETERLILRSWKYEDRETFAEMNGNGNVMKYFPATLSIDESNAFVDRINAEFEETGFGLYAVEIKETGDSVRRGQGYGSALIEFAKQRGATKVDVNEQNPSALNFYKANGFRVISRDETDDAGRQYPMLHLSL